MQKEINNLEEKINVLEGKNIIILQDGFIESKYIIKNMKYKIENEILKILSKDTISFTKINLNQIYKIEIKNEIIKLYLDNDTIINLYIEQ